MQAVGIIIEYNPFHNGHQWHLQAAKAHSGCPFVVGVMSGNFMQRGEPGIFDKWKRAEMAILGGVDLIIELPTVFAVRSAQYFATGGIRLLHALGVVSHVCFGAEHADLTTLHTIATAIKNEEIIHELHIHLKSGKTYAAALGQALKKHYQISPELIASPNNILAVEYLRAIEKFAPNLIPIPVARQQSQYNDTALTAPFASATAIRQALLQNLSLTNEIKAAIPPTTALLIEQLLKEERGPVTAWDFSNILLAQLRTASLEKLEQLPSISEGLHYKIQECALQATHLKELYTLLKSKRYPYTRLQRILTHSLLGTTKEQLTTFDETGPLYARVLAFNDQGRLLLKQIQQQSNVPIITKTTHFLKSKERNTAKLTPLQTMLSIDTLASDIYALGMPASSWKRGGWDFRYPALYVP